MIFHKISLELKRILDKGHMDGSDKKSLVNVVEFVSVSSIYSNKTLKIQVLQGIIKAITADNKVTLEELTNLKRWMRRNTSLRGSYPYDKILKITNVRLNQGFITFEELEEQSVTIRYNKAVAAKYMEYLNQISEDFGLENDTRVSTLSRYPEVFDMDESQVDEEAIWKVLEVTVKGAAENFSESRVKEGENLKNDLIGKLDEMLVNVDFITERSPKIIEEYRERLNSKIAELLGDTQIDENRVLTEVAIFADKSCVDEELVRLRSHIKATKDALTAGGEVGRKLDFIAQEMNREANTTLSKTTDLEIANAAIDLKTSIEKVREQIQNLE